MKLLRMIYLVEVVSTEYDNVSALDRIPKKRTRRKLCAKEGHGKEFTVIGIEETESNCKFL